MAKKASKVQSLEMLTGSDSGYDGINQEALSDKNYLRFLNLFLTNQNQKLDNYLQEHPHLIDSHRHKALFLLNLIVLGQKLQPYHISIRQPNPRIVDELAYQLIGLYKNITEIFEFPEIDFYQYKNLLPSVVIYFSDVILRERSDRKDLMKKLEAELSLDANFINLVDENLRAQQYRLLALYYRRIGDNVKAEEELVKYREAFNSSETFNYKLNKIKPMQFYAAKQLPEQLGAMYDEVSKIQEEALTRSGIYQDTCFYYSCADCCTKDFPVVSLVEFLYIQNSLSKEELEKFTKRAKAIQEKHVKLYGEPLKILDQTTLDGKSKLNPHDMQFACPFLSEDQVCEIHSLRPLACRAFGLSTIDDETVQACKLYLQQYAANSGNRNERAVYDSRPHTAMLGAANALLAAQNQDYANMKQPVGSLVAWLTAE